MNDYIPSAVPELRGGPAVPLEAEFPVTQSRGRWNARVEKAGRCGFTAATTPEYLVLFWRKYSVSGALYVLNAGYKI